MPEETKVEIDPLFVEWTDLSMLVHQQGGRDGLAWWMFVVGSDGPLQERLTRGRIAWARWGSAWKKEGGDSQE